MHPNLKIVMLVIIIIDLLPIKPLENQAIPPNKIMNKEKGL